MAAKLRTVVCFRHRVRGHILWAMTQRRLIYVLAHRSHSLRFAIAGPGLRGGEQGARSRHALGILGEKKVIGRLSERRHRAVHY